MTDKRVRGEGGIPRDCQLCKLNDHQDDVREPTHSTQIAREDGGTKFIYACERCLREMGWFDQRLTEDLDSVSNQGEA